MCEKITMLKRQNDQEQQKILKKQCSFIPWGFKVNMLHFFGFAEQSVAAVDVLW